LPDGGARCHRSARYGTLFAAAALLIAGGWALLLAFGRGNDRAELVAPLPNNTAVTAQATLVDDSPLTAVVPAGSPPMIVVDRDGWILEGYSPPRPIPPIVPSATCAGCGATRLVIATAGPLFSGAVFAAWSINETYPIDEFDLPVTIGAASGRYIGSADASVAASENRVRVVWPLTNGRTAFVDAFGLTNLQTFELAARLNFDSSTPSLAGMPAGFKVLPTPPGAAVTQQIYQRFTGGPVGAEMSGVSPPVIELIVTDGGIQGLLDWRNPGGLFGSQGRPSVIDGTTVLIDDGGEDSTPILAISATWSLGDWNYTAIGHMFQTEDEFRDTVASLRLTDAATFQRAVAAANPYDLGGLTPSIDGTSGVLDTVDG
jgi:hypothetical protein